MDSAKQRNGALSSAAPNVHFFSRDNLDTTNTQYKPQAIRIADDPIMQRAVQKIYNQGPRMVLELLSSLAEKNMQAVAVEREIKYFTLLPRNALRAIECDQIRQLHPLEVPQ